MIDTHDNRDACIELPTTIDARAGFEPDTFHGQHFLIEPEIVDAIVDEFPEGATVVEIGAGTGVLTRPLVEKVGPHGRVIAYEIDGRCFPLLTELETESEGTFRLKPRDFLKVDPANLSAIDELYLVGNVPYHILEPLLRQMIDIQFEKAVLMLPNRFRDSVMAQHAGERGWTKSSIIAKAFFDVEPVIDVPKAAFDPAPPVDSTVVRFTRNDHDVTAAADPTIRAYRAIVQTLTTDETVASVLRKISVRPDGKVEGGGLNDHRRHRGERRRRAVDLRALRNEYNATGAISPEIIARHTGYDLLEVARRALGGSIDRINAPLVAVDTTAIRRVCAAIEGAINRGQKLGVLNGSAQTQGVEDEGLDDL